MNQLTLPAKTQCWEKIIVDKVDQIDIPASVVDFDTFREWLHSATFPEKGKISFVNNTIWVDLSTEEFFTHGQVFQEISRVIGNLMKESR